VQVERRVEVVLASAPAEQPEAEITQQTFTRAHETIRKVGLQMGCVLHTYIYRYVLTIFESGVYDL
jgi:hypothetical protein